MTRPGTSRAFSLLELVLVLAILAIISAIAMPRFANSTTRRSLDSVADRLAADIAQARSRAILQSRSVSIVFSGPSTNLTYTISNTPDLSRGVSQSANLSPVVVNGSANVRPDSASSLDAGPIVQSADFGGNLILTFDGYGVPDSGGAISFTLGGITRTVTVDARTGVPTITR